MSAEHGAVSVSHIGICVSDLDRSLRFYSEGLGFEVSDRHEIGALFGPALEAGDDVELISQFVRRQDLVIELLGWIRPAPSGAPSTSRTELGLTHLSFHVDDVDAALDRLVGLGEWCCPTHGSRSARSTSSS